MKLYLVGHDYRYAAEQMLLMLFPQERPEYPDAPEGGDRVELKLSRGAKRYTAVCRLYREGQCWQGRAAVDCAAITDDLTRDRHLQRILKLAFYRAGVACLGKKPVWGALTGVKPGKLMARYLQAGMSHRAAVSAFCRDYDVSPDRARLCLDTTRVRMEAAASLAPEDVCLYVGIPFCPTRCAYCSFVSASVEKSMKLIPPFLAALKLDVSATARAVARAGLRVVSVYMGGGTPTTLSAAELDVLLTQLETEFDLSHMREFTVEAGRPDTITPEKLRVLRAHRVDRVSVNPQTMDDAVLEAIGRRHTAADILTALDMVRSCGGFAVNMDLIAGLPGDSPAGFSRTLDQVLALAPENITVHTLALKRGSRITLEDTPLPTPEAVGEMLDEACTRLTAGGWAPYYLYRQKFMSGGFENVGWARPGTENLYNICIMEELCSILAMGGGASTKLVRAGYVQRLTAPKYPQEYAANIDKTVADKQQISEFYAQSGDEA